MRQDKLRESCQPKEIYLELVACLVKGNILDRTVGAVPRVINKSVDAPLLGNNGLYSLLDGVFVSNVQLKRNDTEGPKFFKLLNAACGTLDYVPCGCKIFSGVVADT